jgi:hypothetical protein
MNMVMTILEARVAKENWQILQEAYQEAAQQRDIGLEQSFMIHSKKEPDLWRILTVWHNQEALDALRNSGETPRGVLMFREAKAEPTLSIFDVDQWIPLEYEHQVFNLFFTFTKRPCRINSPELTRA